MKGCLVEFLAFLFIVGVFSLIAAVLSIAHCSAVRRDLDCKTEWHWFTGCVVEQPDGKKVLFEKIRNFE